MGFFSPLPLRFCAALVCTAALQAACQQPAPEAAKAAAGFEEPQLIPTQMPLTPSEKCKKRRRNTIQVSVVIDETGVPHQVHLLSAVGTEEDLWALHAVTGDRFNPSREGGVAQIVKRSVAVEMEACYERVKQSDGSQAERMWMAGLPKQTLKPPQDDAKINSKDLHGPKENAAVERVGGRVSSPVPILTPEAEYTDKARKAHYQGQCLIQLIVDQYGIPQNLRIVRPLGIGLDEKALEAVRRYRFTPAYKQEVGPVPVIITIAVNFRLY